MSNDRQKIEEDSFLQTEEQKDQMADHMSDALTASDVASIEEAVDEPTQEPALTALEEERVRDEVEIQIDLLKDPDWAVRREAAITLGEMGDERCVEPLVRALQD